MIKNLIILDNTFQPIGEILPGEYTNDRLTESLETGFFTKRFTIDKRKFADAEKLKKDTHLMTTDENGEKLLLSIFSIDNATEFEIDVTYEDFPVSFLQGEAKALTAPSTGNETYTTANSSGATQTTTTSSTSQPTAKQFDNSKATIATSPISTAGYTASKVNMFRVDQADPAHITGAYIDDFLRRGYPDSPIIGYGKDVKELSDYYGISAGAFLGVAAKETVFGRSSSGGRYNFTGITSGPGKFFDNIFPKKFAVDRQWIDPPTVRDGIAAFFHLARYNYVEKGFVQYDRFTERWAPSSENDTHSVKSKFWGVITSLGYSTTDTTYKTNKSKSTDNPNGLKINATSTQTIVTNQNQQIVTTSEDGELIPQELAFYLNESLDGTPIETGTLDTIELRAISYPKEKLATRIQNICKDFNLYPKYTTIFEDAKSYTPVSIRLDLVKRRGRLTDIRFDSDINLLSAQYSSNKNGLITGIDVIPHAENRTIETVQTQAVPTQAVEVVKSSEGNKTQKQLEYLKRQTGGTYTQSAARNNWSPEPVSADCSSMVYKSLIYAGIPCGYKKGDWLGTTYTLRDHARRGLYYDIVSASQPLEPGDIILCVNWGHVVTYIGNGEIFHASLWGQPHRKQKNNYGRGNMVLRPKDRGSQTVSKPSTTQTTKIGNSLQDQNWKWLKNEGATDVGASGIMGNISVESGFDPTRKQNGGGPGRGLVQWTVNERWVPVTNWIQSQGGDIYSVEWQIKAIKWELTNGWESTNMMNRVAQYGGTRKSNGWESFMSITNLEKSVMCFLEVYERAGIPHASRRVSEGQRVLKAYQGTYNGDSVTTASGNTTTTTNSVQKEVIYDISDIEYDDGDFYTHKGSNEIISREAQCLYGWNKRNLSHHKLGVHEMKSININAEFELALNELKERSQPKESYRIIIDAEDPATASTLRVLRIGDTLKIVSKNWANGQDLILEADVAELVRSDTNKELEAITITNYKRIYAKIPDRVLEIQQRINEREELFNKNLVLSLLADNATFTNLSDSSSIEAKVSNVNEDLTGRLVDDDFYWQVFGSDGLPLTRDDEIDILGVDNIAEPGANYKRFRTLNVIEGAKYKINILEKGADFIIRAIHKDGFVIQESERFDDYENLIYEAPSFAQYLEVDVFESTTDKPIAVLTFPTLVDFNGKNITIPSDLINKSATVTLQVGESKTSINLSEADLAVVSAVPPENPKEGQRWIKKEVDGSHTIYVFKNGEWEKQVDQQQISQVTIEVNNAMAEAEQAKEDAVQARDDAIAEAEAKVQAKDAEYQVIFEQYDNDVETLNNSINEANSKADNALIEAGVSSDLAQTAKDASDRAEANANSAVISAGDAVNKATQAQADAETAKSASASAVTTAQDAYDDAQTAKAQASNALTDSGTALATAQDAYNDAQTAKSQASSAIADAGIISSKMTEVIAKSDDAVAKANAIPETIDTFIIERGLTTGTYVDTQIDELTGEISHTIESVKGNIPTIIMGVEWDKSENPELTRTHYLEEVSDNNYPGIIMGVYWDKTDNPKLIRTDYVSESPTLLQYEIKTAGYDATINGITADLKERVSTQDYQADKSNEFGFDISGIRGQISNVELNKMDNADFKNFKQLTYDADVSGIRSSITDLVANKLDGTDFETFKQTELKQTVDGLEGQISAIDRDKLSDVDFESFKLNEFKATVDGINTSLTQRVTTTDYQTDKSNEFGLGISGLRGRITDVERDKMNSGDFDDFKQLTYDADVESITTNITNLSKDKLDGVDFETFKSNELKQTVEGLEGKISAVDSKKVDNETFSNFRTNEFGVTVDGLAMSISEIEGSYPVIVMGVEWDKGESPELTRTDHTATTNDSAFYPGVVMGVTWDKSSDPKLVRTDYTSESPSIEIYNTKTAEYDATLDGITASLKERVTTTDYQSDKSNEFGMDVSGLRTRISSVETGKMDGKTFDDFKRLTYDVDVDGINTKITALTTDKLDGSEFETFKNVELKQTVDGLSGQISAIERDKLSEEDFGTFKTNDFQVAVNNINTAMTERVDKTDYQTDKSNEFGLGITGLRGRISSVESSKMDKSDFESFKDFTYDADVNGIRGDIIALKTDKLESEDFETFKNNEFALTVDGLRMSVSQVEGSSPTVIMGVEWDKSENPTLTRTDYTATENENSNYPGVVMGVSWDKSSDSKLVRTNYTSESPSLEDYEVFRGDYDFNKTGWNATTTYVSNNQTKINKLVSNVDGWESTINHVDQNKTAWNETTASVDSLVTSIGSDGGKIAQMVMTDDGFQRIVGELEGSSPTIVMGVEWDKSSSPKLTRTGYTDESNSLRIAEFADSWSMQLKSGRDVKTAINATQDGLRLSGKLIHLDGTTLIDNGVVKSAHIDNLNANKVIFTQADIIKLRADVLDANVVTADHIDGGSATVDAIFSDYGAFETLVSKEMFIQALTVSDIEAEEISALEASFKALNSQLQLDGNRIRITNTAKDFAEMNNIPEFRSQDSAGTAAIMGKGRSHYYSGNQPRFYIGTDLDTGKTHGVHIQKGQTWGIYRPTDAYGGTPAQYHTVQPGESWRSITTMYYSDSEPVWTIVDLNGVARSPLRYLQPNEVILVRPGTTGNESGVERIWTMGTASDNVTTRSYSHVYHVFEKGTSGSSDARLKHDIEPTDIKSLDHIDSLTFKKFRWNDDNRFEPLGLIAQQSGILRVEDDEFEGFDIQRAIMLALKGAQELHEKVKSLEEEIAILKGV